MIKDYTITENITSNNIECKTGITNNVKPDSIKIEGLVEIENGPIHIKAKNKFVDTMFQHIINMISGIGHTTANSCYGPVSNCNIYIGSNTTTPTTHNTTALTYPIGTVPGTAPNSIGGSVTNPSVGVFRTNITATWIAGMSGTLGEIGLYLTVYPAGNLRAFQWVNVSYTPASPVLVSRLSVADGDFSPFNIITENPLSISWAIQLSFV